MTYDQWMSESDIIADTYHATHDGAYPAHSDVAHILYRRAFETMRFPTLAKALEEWTGVLPVPGRTGRVRMDGKCMADDGGPWLALGASLFWAVRGARDDPERLISNLRWLRERGVDFVRVMAETTDWAEDRRTDPRAALYLDSLRNCRDYCADAGLRIAWTIFGGNDLDPEEQERCFANVMQVCDERHETVQGIEISNESNGFQNDGNRRMRAFCLAASLHGYPVTLTSAAHCDAALYPGSAASFGNVHFDRKDGDNGWRWVRQPWGYPGEYPGVPSAFASLEPGGPGASVYSDTDPERIAMAAVHTWLCGGCAHVVHFGAGIYGVANDHPTAGHRPANVWEQESLEAALALVKAHIDTLPADLPNWNRTRHGLSDHPFVFEFDAASQKFLTVGDLAIERRQGCVRAYAAYAHGRYCMAVVGIMDRCDFAPQRTNLPVSLRERDGRSQIVQGDYT